MLSDLLGALKALNISHILEEKGSLLQHIIMDTLKISNDLILFIIFGKIHAKTSQELRMLSTVTINCQVTKIVMNSGSQLSGL